MENVSKLPIHELKEVNDFTPAKLDRTVKTDMTYLVQIADLSNEAWAGAEK